jgi:hypothetical protein
LEFGRGKVSFSTLSLQTDSRLCLVKETAEEEMEVLETVETLSLSSIQMRLWQESACPPFPEFINSRSKKMGMGVKVHKFGESGIYRDPCTWSRRDVMLWFPFTLPS